MKNSKATAVALAVIEGAEEAGHDLIAAIHNAIRDFEGSVLVVPVGPKEAPLLLAHVVLDGVEYTISVIPTGLA